MLRSRSAGWVISSNFLPMSSVREKPSMSKNESFTRVMRPSGSAVCAGTGLCSKSSMARWDVRRIPSRSR